MCDVQAALQVVGAVVSHRQKKADNKAIKRDQQKTRDNADKAYLHDLNKIDQEKVNADMEKTKAEIETKATRDAEVSQSLNLGFGNGVKVVQSISGLYDSDWINIGSEYSKDLQLFTNQKTEAYANMAKTYNSLTPPTEPSNIGLALDVASSANGGYQRNETKKSAKKTG